MLEKLYQNPQKSAKLLIIFVAIFSTLYNAFLPLHGDEAYYWVWSKNLQGGYYDHAPLIAFMIALTNLISESEWGVRLVNVISLSITAFVVFELTKKISDAKTALNAVLIFMSVILVHAGYIITTPDSPLLLFWSLTLYFAYTAFFEQNTKRSFFLMGLFMGLAMLSKYSAILLAIALMLFVVLKKRELFLTPKPYIAILTALVVISPMLYWNYEHEWISFLFQLNHGSSESYSIDLEAAFGFIGGQFLLFSPVFCAVLFYALYKKRLFFRDEKLLFFALITAFTLGFFFYKALFKNLGLNYTAPAFVSGVIVVAYFMSKYEMQRLFKIGLVVALSFTLLGRIAMLFFLDKVQERMYASDAIVERFVTHMKAGDALYGDHLTIAAYISYYLPSHPKTDVGIDSRFSQYDMWREPSEWHKDGLVLARNDKCDGELLKYYKSVELIDTHIVIPKVRTFYTYRVADAYTNEEMKKRGF